MEKLFILLQFILPQHLLSRCVGVLARLRHPVVLKNALIGLFVRVFEVNMAEAEQPDYTAYSSFNDFFTRPLRADARTLADAEIVCPADGVISQLGDISHGTLLQAKNRYFSLAELFGGDKEQAAQYDGGQFATIYLSPKDYHRVHMPVAGRLTATCYIPGTLFSVNSATALGVDRLFARNERLVAYFETAHGPMAMVLVGAMIVAGIETVWSGSVAPPPRRQLAVSYTQLPAAVTLGQGEEMGRFLLGSTVILLFPAGTMSWAENYAPCSKTLMGQPFGSYQ